MSTFLRCDESVTKMAEVILHEYPCYEPLLEAEVKIDFVFAFPKYNEQTGEAEGHALKLHGVRALGIARKIGLKDRALGRGDAEISLDGEWWEGASDEDRKALLDHELYHLKVRIKDGVIMRDDLKRPMIEMRPHDFEVGWFAAVAARHGKHSQEQQQATQVMEKAGQFFWPELAGEVEPTKARTRKTVGGGVQMTIVSGGKTVHLSSEELSRAADRLGQVSDNSDIDEDIIQQCVEVIRSEQKASVSLLQRRLRLGYTRASRIMDELETRGIVGPSKGAEPRDILIDLNQSPAVAGGGK